MKISKAEKLWRTKQLLKELACADKKRQAKPVKGIKLV
jgi:hypothetical protein